MFGSRRIWKCRIPDGPAASACGSHQLRAELPPWLRSVDVSHGSARGVAWRCRPHRVVPASMHLYIPLLRARTSSPGAWVVNGASVAEDGALRAYVLPRGRINAPLARSCKCFVCNGLEKRAELGDCPAHHSDAGKMVILYRSAGAAASRPDCRSARWRGETQRTIPARNPSYLPPHRHPLYSRPERQSVRHSEPARRE